MGGGGEEEGVDEARLVDLQETFECMGLNAETGFGPFITRRLLEVCGPDGLSNEDMVQWAFANEDMLASWREDEAQAGEPEPSTPVQETSTEEAAAVEASAGEEAAEVSVQAAAAPETPAVQAPVSPIGEEAAAAEAKLRIVAKHRELVATGMDSNQALIEAVRLARLEAQADEAAAEAAAAPAVTSDSDDDGESPEGWAPYDGLPMVAHGASRDRPLMLTVNGDRFTQEDDQGGSYSGTYRRGEGFNAMFVISSVNGQDLPADMLNPGLFRQNNAGAIETVTIRRNLLEEGFSMAPTEFAASEHYEYTKYTKDGSPAAAAAAEWVPYDGDPVRASGHVAAGWAVKMSVEGQNFVMEEQPRSRSTLSLSLSLSLRLSLKANPES